MGYNTVSFGGISLNITNITPVKTQRTVKQVVGKSLVENRVVGVSGQQWRLAFDGIVTGTTSANLDTNRSNLIALDDAATHAYVDNLHDGTFYLVPGSLNFDDEGDVVQTHYKYSMVLVEQ